MGGGHRNIRNGRELLYLCTELIIIRVEFGEMFRQVAPEDIGDNVFTLTGRNFYAITAGNSAHYNTMAGSGGGMGTLFRRPVAWCVIRQDRYTLELIMIHKAFTLSYLPDQYKGELLALGSESGRNSAKMTRTGLTAIGTPAGNIAFREARLVVECRLMQVTTPAPGDFISAEASRYIDQMYKDPAKYRRYVFGEITGVWVK